MGIRIINGIDTENDGKDVSVLYCSTSGRAFGPVFRGDEAELDALNGLQRFARERGTADLRALPDPDLDAVIEAWRADGSPSESTYEDTDDA